MVVLLRSDYQMHWNGGVPACRAPEVWPQPAQALLTCGRHTSCVGWLRAFPPGSSAETLLRSRRVRSRFLTLSRWHLPSRCYSNAPKKGPARALYKQRSKFMSIYAEQRGSAWPALPRACVILGRVLHPDAGWHIGESARASCAMVERKNN